MEAHRITRRVPPEAAAPVRLDVFVTEELGLFPRSQFAKRVVALTVNGREAKASKKVKAGDEVEVTYADPPPLEVDPEAMPLEIIYEDANVIVLNKPSGLVVHPGAGHRSHTLVNGLLAHVAALKEAFGGSPLRPGIVHRLDKETSGVIIAAKHPAALEHLARQFRRRKAKKLYLAVVRGRLKQRSGRLETVIARDRVHRQRFIVLRPGPDGPVRGKTAVTDYRVLREWEGAKESLVALKPRTGRTHQLRVHMKHLGCPILGDDLYGAGRPAGGERLMLHAYKLKIVLPGEKRARVFTAGLPEAFIKRLRKSGRGDTPRSK